jgi:predicted DNA-binding protein
MANVNSTQTSFRIRLDLYDKLRFQAVKENRSQGEILNEALEDYLQKVENQTTFDEKL